MLSACRLSLSGQPEVAAWIIFTVEIAQADRLKQVLELLVPAIAQRSVNSPPMNILLSVGLNTFHNLVLRLL
jgi:hypothetical protein